MLSVPVPAHPEGPARLLAMGSVCCSGRVVLTRILSCKVSCRILDATLSSSTLLRCTCSEGSEFLEGLLDSSSSLSSSSDLLSPPPLGLPDSSEVVLLRPESTARGPVFALPSSLLRFFLCGTLLQALAATSPSWGTRAMPPWMVFFGGVTFCRALAPVAEGGAMTTRTITLSVAW